MDTTYLHDPEIVADFSAEVTDHLDSVADLALAAEDGDEEAMAELRRVIHTIKGAAGFVGLDMMSELCHELEEMILGRMSGGARPCHNCFDQVHEACDLLREWLEEVERCCRDQDDFRISNHGRELLTRIKQTRAA